MRVFPKGFSGFFASVFYKTALAATMLPWAGMGLLMPVEAQPPAVESRVKTVADFDLACRYKGQTYTFHGKVIQRPNNQNTLSNTLIYQPGPANDLNYLFPTGTCADLVAYFDPFAMRPPEGKDALRLRTLPSETIQGVICRVVEMLDPDPPSQQFQQTIPTLPRVKIRWHIGPDGQTRRMRGEFQLVKADGKMVDTNLLVMEADYTFRGPNGSPARPASGPPLRALQVPLAEKGAVRGLACSPAAPLLAAVSNLGAVTVWDAVTLKPIYSLTGHAGWGQSLIFSGNGQRLAEGTIGNSGVVCVWDIVTGRQIQTLDTKAQGITAVALSPDGRLLATKGFTPNGNEPVHIWEVETGKSIAELDAKNAEQVVFSPDGRTLATGSYDTIRLWDTALWKERATLQQNLEGGSYIGGTPIVFSPDSVLLAVGDTHGGGQVIGLIDSSHYRAEDPFTVVQIWDVQTGKRLHVLKGTTGPVHALAFAPNGKLLAVADRDYGPEGEGGNSAVLLWNTQTWQQAGIVGVEHGKPIDLLAWTADSATLVTSYNDANIKFWAVPAN